MLPFFMSFIYILNKIMSTDDENPFKPRKNASNNSNPFQLRANDSNPFQPRANASNNSNPFQLRANDSSLFEPRENDSNYSDDSNLFKSVLGITGSTSSVLEGTRTSLGSGLSVLSGFFSSMLPKGSSSSSSVENGGYSFLNPSSLQLPSAVTLILILMIFIVLISYWAYIKSNWEQVKCKDGRFWIAPLFGKSTQETIKDCTTKEIQITVNKNLQGEIERLADLDASVNELQTQINDSSGEATTLKDDTKSTLTNITNILESNINYVKGALSTILASIYISSNLNKGALTSYADLQKSDIAEIIDKYNNVNMDEANLNFI